MRVLLVEDNPHDVRLIAHALRKLDPSVEYECVEDPWAMRAALARGDWDVIISDWAMPRFSALGALDVVKETGVDVPFIILSGAIGKDAAVNAMRAGAHDFLVKDNLALLVPAIQRALLACEARKTQRPGRGPVPSADLDRGGRASKNASLEGRLRRAFVLIGVLVAFALVTALLSFVGTLLWVLPEVAACSQARSAASERSEAVLDQEAAVRGYLLTRDGDFIDQYRRSELALARVDEVLGANAALFAAAFARTHAAEELWHAKWAEPAIDTPAGEPVPSLEDGKALFDDCWREQTIFLNTIARRTESLSRYEQRITGALVAFLLTILSGLLIVSVREHDVLRSVLQDAVATLLEEIGRIRDGELTTAVSHSGPSELRKIRAGLNEMLRALAVAKGVAESRDELVREHSDRLRQALDASRDFPGGGGGGGSDRHRVRGPGSSFEHHGRRPLRRRHRVAHGG